jgi:hypothetical protein
MHATRRGDVAYRERGARGVRAARTQSDDGSGMHLGHLHRGSHRRHRQADAHDTRRHVRGADARPHGVAEDGAERRELRQERREEEDVTPGHRFHAAQTTLPIALPRLLASIGPAD